MNIYVVQSGDTISSIAANFGISDMKLIQDNDLEDLENLVVGQALVIAKPEQTYVIKDGDTLNGIADAHGVTPIQLLRNNPYLAGREFLYPGDILIISYGIKKGKMTINGFTYPFIGRETLIRTLPYLTSLTVFDYRITEEGGLIDLDDQEIVTLAKKYGVAPVMMVSTLTNLGLDNADITYNVISNPSMQDNLISNILNTLKTKGYYAVNVSLQNIDPEYKPLVENFIANITNRLNGAGYPVVVTLTPQTFTGFYQDIDYTTIGEISNHILLLSYEWGFSYGPPTSVTSIGTVREMMNYSVTQVVPEKLSFGIPIIGYDWQLPYIPGVSRANSISTNGAVRLASEVGATIQYDEVIQAPYFYYLDFGNKIPTDHVVWFKDARRVNVLLDLVPEYGVQGVAIWNIMQYCSQLWLLINSQYDIETDNQAGETLQSYNNSFPLSPSCQ
ncbi:LysM peptidoglycan-binding domain-containing protein [Anaerocolumna sp. MB42-C2]|uniref:LysM peptidoglycan-binding domain-containing protein n=1 Tax=Anaerocolumna sp. MB42-C2 TaxID=3070997 RepID=UPI0027DF2976|nr:LysM peptidoglycan-binding domain-containing protein [Anaerocolumna sp. MB42-C2]WMJ87589.1 LysM peptidoglycan-binding domain-containing protein [Anaerocolumna sp. MB42-C2]